MTGINTEGQGALTAIGSAANPLDSIIVKAPSQDKTMGRFDSSDHAPTAKDTSSKYMEILAENYGENTIYANKIGDNGRTYSRAGIVENSTVYNASNIEFTAGTATISGTGVEADTHGTNNIHADRISVINSADATSHIGGEHSHVISNGGTVKAYDYAVIANGGDNNIDISDGIYVQASADTTVYTAKHVNSAITTAKGGISVAEVYGIFADQAGSNCIRINHGLYNDGLNLETNVYAGASSSFDNLTPSGEYTGGTAKTTSYNIVANHSAKNEVYVDIINTGNFIKSAEGGTATLDTYGIAAYNNAANNVQTSTYNGSGLINILASAMDSVGEQYGANSIGADTYINAYGILADSGTNTVGAPNDNYRVIKSYEIDVNAKSTEDDSNHSSSIVGANIWLRPIKAVFNTYGVVADNNGINNVYMGSKDRADLNGININNEAYVIGSDRAATPVMGDAESYAVGAYANHNGANNLYAENNITTDGDADASYNIKGSTDFLGGKAKTVTIGLYADNAASNIIDNEGLINISANSIGSSTTDDNIYNNVYQDAKSDDVTATAYGLYAVNGGKNLVKGAAKITASSIGKTKVQGSGNVASGDMTLQTYGLYADGGSNVLQGATDVIITNPDSDSSNSAISTSQYSDALGGAGIISAYQIYANHGGSNTIASLGSIDTKYEQHQDITSTLSGGAATAKDMTTSLYGFYADNAGMNTIDTGTGTNTSFIAAAKTVVTSPNGQTQANDVKADVYGFYADNGAHNIGNLGNANNITIGVTAANTMNVSMTYGGDNDYYDGVAVANSYGLYANHKGYNLIHAQNFTNINASSAMIDSKENDVSLEEGIPYETVGAIAQVNSYGLYADNDGENTLYVDKIAVGNSGAKIKIEYGIGFGIGKVSADSYGLYGDHNGENTVYANVITAKSGDATNVIGVNYN